MLLTQSLPSAKHSYIPVTFSLISYRMLKHDNPNKNIVSHLRSHLEKGTMQQ